MSKSSAEKAKFRRTSKWKKFRAFMKKECGGIDYVTNKKLLKGYQLHHKDMRTDNYSQLIPDRFVCCNRKTHELIHFCFNYYKNDRAFILRLKEILEEMCEYNKD